MKEAQIYPVMGVKIGTGGVAGLILWGTGPLKHSGAAEGVAAYGSRALCSRQ